MKLTFDEPRKPGRPAGTGGDYSKVLAAIAEEICERRATSVRSATTFAHQSIDGACSARHLRRLYNVRRARLEAAYMAERDIRDKEAARYSEYLLPKYRGWITSRVQIAAKAASATRLVTEQPVPIERWFLAELEDCLRHLLPDARIDPWTQFLKEHGPRGADFTPGHSD